MSYSKGPYLRCKATEYSVILMCAHRASVLKTLTQAVNRSCVVDLNQVPASNSTALSHHIARLPLSCRLDKRVSSSIQLQKKIDKF